MLSCRSSGRCVVAVDRALRSVHRLADVTVTLHKGHALHTHRGSAGGAHEWTRRHRADPPHRAHRCVFRVPVWPRLDRVATITAGWSQSRGVCCGSGVHDRWWRWRTSGGPQGDAWVTGAGGSWTGTRTMHTRAAAAAKRRDVDDDQPTERNKEDEQTLKDASAASSSTAKAPGESESEPEGDKPSKTQQLKKVFKEYGAVGVSFHIGISLMSLGMCYLLISSGIDMAAVLCKVGFSEAVVKSKMAAGTSTFVLAYAIHKLFAPVRISITLMSVPLIVRYFRKTGLFKPPSPAP